MECSELSLILYGEWHHVYDIVCLYAHQIYNQIDKEIFFCSLNACSSYNYDFIVVYNIMCQQLCIGLS